MANFFKPVNSRVVFSLSTCNIAHIFICSYFHICSEYQKNFKYHKCWPIPVKQVCKGTVPQKFLAVKTPFPISSTLLFLVGTWAWFLKQERECKLMVKLIIKVEVKINSDYSHKVFLHQTCSRMSLGTSACVLCAGQMTDTCQMLGCRHEVMQLCQYG